MTGTQTQNSQLPTSTTITPEHATRVRQELRNIGASSYGLAKFASQYLYHLIRKNEHIHGAVYGRYSNGDSRLKFNEGMLVATDRRVIFLDHKPGYTDVEELTYEAVSGVRSQSAGLFAAVTLYTKIGDFTLTYASTRCIRSFIEYIESRRIDTEDNSLPTISIAGKSSVVAPGMDERARGFLQTHDTGVLSTLSRNDDIHGAVVHYIMNNHGHIFVLTKAGTQKTHDIMARPDVAFTVYDTDHLQTIQLQSHAQIEPTQKIKDWVFNNIVQPHTYGDKKHMPPVTKLHHGAFIILRIVPTSAHFSDFTT